MNYFLDCLVVTSFHNRTTPACRFTTRPSAFFCARLRTHPCKLTNPRVVVTHTAVSRNRLSALIASTTRSLISASCLYGPPHSQVPARQHDVPRSARECACERISRSSRRGGFAGGHPS